MKNRKIELKWALVFVGLQLGWMLLERVTGLHGERIDQHVTFTNFFAIPAIVVYAFALVDKRNNFYLGTMTYLQGMTSGLIITLFVTVVSPLTQLIVSEVISPEYFGNAIAYATSEGILTQEEAVKYFSLENYIIQGLEGTPLMGILTSVVVAFFTRKKTI